jgi:hypothetical protein
MRGAFVVDEIPSERWDAALDLIASGGPLVVVEREVALGLQRYVGWPRADARIHVSAYTTTEPSRLTEAAIERDVHFAVQLLADVIQHDGRLGQLLSDIGYEFEYLYDYGMGAVKVGFIDPAGRVTLE